MQNGDPPRFANDQVRPLDDDDGHEEGRLARVLQDLPVAKRPFLSVRIGKVVDAARVPGGPEADQFPWEESVLRHDHKVSKETGGGLDHPYLKSFITSEHLATYQ